MKLPLNRFWSIAALALIAFFLTLLFFLIWFKSQLAPEETRLLSQLFKHHFEPILAIAFVLCIIIAWAVDIIYRSYIYPIRQISEEMSLIDEANPAHRIKARGAAEIRTLCNQINEKADHHESVEKSIQNRIRIARAASEQEKNILAAIVAELSEGVIICNPDGQILLCNNRAKDMLTGGENHNATEEMFSQRRARFVARAIRFFPYR